MWCVAELNEEYVAKMEDVLATYEQPYDAREPVVCLDEKPVTLHAEVRPASSARPGREARRDSEYKRCGTANVFCAVEPKAGRHFTFAASNSGNQIERIYCSSGCRTRAYRVRKTEQATDIAIGPELTAQAWNLYSEGLWLDEIAKRLGIDPVVVRKAIEREAQEGH